MPTTDEDLLRDLLRGSTNDLALRPGGAHAIVTRQRRRQVRRRFAAVGVTGVAAAVALTVAEGGAAPQAKPSLAGPGQARAVHLTTGQVVLDGLAVRAAAQPDGQRYVVFTEDRAPTKQTSVYDRLTGNMWVYQQGGGAPPVAVVKHGSPTSAELAAKLPANQAALRAFLIKDANADDAKAAAFARRSRPHAPPYVDRRTSNGKVFDQAIDYLYMPLVPSAQRSAMFKLLAATPGVQVRPHARDSLGRPAIMLRNSDGPVYGTTTVFEDPATTRPLEEDFAGVSFTGKDVFKSITFTNTRPADPYRHN
jgi:hypothetical protein